MKSISLGLIFKGLALLSKAIFLLLIVPKLPAGVFGSYFYILTLSVIVSRIISMGAMEYLPNVIGNNIKQASAYLPFVILLFVCGIFFITLYQVQSMSAILALAFVFASCHFLVGLIRTIYKLSFDIINNLPWILFTCIVLFYDIANSQELVLILFLCHSLILISSLTFLFLKRVFAFIMPDLKELKPLSIELVKGYKVWLPIVISSILQVFLLRSYLLVNKSCLDADTLDEISLIISICEACWQLSMVVINRYYSTLYSAKVSFLAFIKTILFSGSLLVVTSSLIFLGGNYTSSISNLFLQGSSYFAQTFVCLSVLVWSAIKFYLWFEKKLFLALKLELAFVSLALLLTFFISVFPLYSLTFALFKVLILGAVVYKLRKDKVVMFDNN